MRALALAVGLMFAAAPALACVCSPLTPQERRETAARIAASATAVVEVEQIRPMNHEGMRGETYRVVKVHSGKAPAQFELERGFERQPDGSVGMAVTSCDVVSPAGERTTVVLYAARSPSRFRMGDTCSHLFINSPGAVDLVRQEARKLGGERG